MSSIHYRPEIDGLRAFAVIPVILFHMGVGWCAGGYIGVDVFFVISGYLITSILLKELQSGQFTFRGFWGRRVRRILPMLLVVTAATLAIVYAFVYKPDRPLLARQAIAALVSVANIYFCGSSTSYWSPEAEESPFLHAWSLSVEEQFYLLLPIVVWWIVRYRPRWLRGVLITLLVASLGLFAYGVHVDPNRTFYLLPTRAWELATGSLLAVWMHDAAQPVLRTRVHSLLAIAGLGLVLGCYLLLPTLGLGLAFAVLGTALVLARAQTGPVHRLLSLPPIVHIGKVSYSLYLWHWPVIVLAEYFRLIDSKLLLLAPIYLLSLASYLLVERPLRVRPTTTPYILGAFLMLLWSASSMTSSIAVYDASAFERPHWFALYYDLRPQNMDGSMQRVAIGVDMPPREAPADAYLHGGIIVGDAAGPPRVVVLGDSHGVMWSDAIRTAVESLGVKTAFLSMNGVPPFFGDSRIITKSAYLSEHEQMAFDAARAACLREWRPDLVIVCARWQLVHPGTADVLLEFLARHAGHVLLVEQPPVLADVGTRNALQYLIYRGLATGRDDRCYVPAGECREIAAGRDLVRKLTSSYPHCGRVLTHDLYAQGDSVLALEGRTALYIDDNHLTTAGARRAAPRIKQAVAEALDHVPPRQAQSER